MLGDVPTQGIEGLAVLDPRGGLESAVESRRDFGEAERHLLAVQPLVGKDVADAPHVGAHGAAIVETQFVEAQHRITGWRGYHAAWLSVR